MDQAVQIIGLTIMCLGLVGTGVGIVGIMRSYAKSGEKAIRQDERVG